MDCEVLNMIVCVLSYVLWPQLQLYIIPIHLISPQGANFRPHMRLCV